MAKSRGPQWLLGNLNSLKDVVRTNLFVRNFINGLRAVYSNRPTAIYFTFLIFVLGLGLIGPHIAPYDYDESLRSDEGDLLRSQPPTADHVLGTDSSGRDVLSRILVGARPTVITGVLGGSLIISIGMMIGTVSGYMGGWVDTTLMRFTDLVYGVPLIPFAIVLISLIGIGFINSILVIGLVLWRGNARVLRSQVLQIKERPYILAAKASGGSTRRILTKHIIPNIAGMAVLFFALGVGYSIIIQAGLAFLGVSNPFVPSWGIMVRNAYESGLMGSAWWWSIPPGLMISLTVLSTFMFGRKFEELSGADQQGDQAIVSSG